MKKKIASSENTRICDAALRLAAKGWAQVTLDKVAKEAKIPAAKLKQLFASINDIAALMIAETSKEALAAAGKPSGNPHDFLFDLLMSRFEIMQKNRAAILNIADVAKRDRALSCALAKASFDSFYAFVDASQIKTPPRPLLATGLGAIHAWAFIAWRHDDSRDLAKTMAALDRGLRLAGKAVGLLTRNS